MAAAFIVLLRNNKFIVLREEWIESPILSTESKVYFSPSCHSVADFSIEQKYFFRHNETSCYMAYICKRFNTEGEAERYLQNRQPRVSRWFNHRRVCSRSPQIVETIEIISESSDDKVFNENEGNLASGSPSEGLNKNKLLPINRQLKIILDRNEVKSLLEIHENSPHKHTSSGSSGVSQQSIQDSNTPDLDDLCMDLSQVSAENITQASGESLVINSKTKKVLQKNQQMDTSSKVMTRKRFQQFVEEDSANRKYARAQAVKLQNQCRISLASTVPGSDDPKYDRWREIVVKLEKENEDLHTANIRLNKRVGDEFIMDTSSESSDENEFETDVNTRHYQVDGSLAKRYYYITNARGDRFYLNQALKIRIEVVDTLKKMNNTYPKNTENFDEGFLYRAISSIFKKEVLQGYIKTNSMRQLPKTHLKFLKDLFYERTNGDKERMKGFRGKVMNAAKMLLQKAD